MKQSDLLESEKRGSMLSKALQAAGCVFVILFTQGLALLVNKVLSEDYPITAFAVPILWLVWLVYFFTKVLKDVK